MTIITPNRIALFNKVQLDLQHEIGLDQQQAFLASTLLTRQAQVGKPRYRARVAGGESGHLLRVTVSALPLSRVREEHTHKPDAVSFGVL